MRATEISSRVRRAIADLKRGKMVILTDDEDRENEGDLVMAAEKVTPRAINFMARHGRGLICLALTEEKVRALALPLMVSDNTSAFQTAFTVSIEAARGVTTGISAADRATTIRAAIAPDARPADLARPGHIFPLRARAGGVLVRPGQTEGSVDLARLAGLQPAGVICEILNEDGTMARRPQLLRFARRHRLTLLSVADLIAYRLTHERLVERLGEVEVPGGMRAVAYRSLVDPASVHLALTVGDLSGSEPMLTRIHRSTSLGDTLEQATGKGPLRAAHERIMSEGRGVLVRLAHTARGEPLALAPPSNEQRIPGHPGESRLREFGIGSQILKDLGLKRIRLLTRLPNRIVGVERYGIEVVEQIFLGAPRSEEPPPAKGQVVPLRATRLARR